MLFSKHNAFKDMEKEMDYASHISRLELREIERSFSRVFTTEEGRKVLAWLQVMTFQRAGNANTPSDNLRFMEGQRSLMASILRMIDRGKSN